VAVAGRGAMKAGSRIFRCSAWDIVPAFLVYLHLGLLLGFFLAWPHLSWAARIGGGVLYACAIGWNQDSVAHNFIHNPFFTSRLANRITAFALTLENGAPQTMYRWVHMRHHAGNADRPGPDGKTIDPISLYAHGADGLAEPMLRYVLLGFWRDDGPFQIARQIGAKRPAEARRALAEFWVMAAAYGAMALIHWDFVVTLAPFYYLGQSLSFLIAYYEHLGAEPDDPRATGVSAYGRLYNWAFLNNGYHAEHHFRPNQHWSRMAALRPEVSEACRAANAPTLRLPHFLGFSDPAVRGVPVKAAKL